MGNVLGENVGVNGTYFDVGNPNGTDTTWGIAINDGKNVDVNSHVSNYLGNERGTVYFDGQMHVERIYNIRNKNNVSWAISGIEIIPVMDAYKEGFVGPFSDVVRRCNHTGIFFDEKYVYLIVAENLFLKDFKAKVEKNFKVLGGVALDGGGSTQMNYLGKGLKSSRKIGTAVLLKEI